MSSEDFLKNIITGLVEHKDAVNVTKTVDEMGVLLTVDVHKEDMGVIIGRSGNTATAIRAIMRAFGMKQQPLQRINIRINEPQ